MPAPTFGCTCECTVSCPCGGACKPAHRVSQPPRHAGCRAGVAGRSHPASVDGGARARVQWRGCRHGGDRLGASLAARQSCPPRAAQGGRCACASAWRHMEAVVEEEGRHEPPAGTRSPGSGGRATRGGQSRVLGKGRGRQWLHLVSIVIHPPRVSPHSRCGRPGQDSVQDGPQDEAHDEAQDEAASPDCSCKTTYRWPITCLVWGR